ncbi:aBC transporter ATPase component [Staphylococcus sp. CAG:324]|nr:ABC transporter ATP-binding protein/permease [Bacilli bacterium]CDC69201.1 aBC transporter ATPase component [Staphylococcus sp. CAG:324]
MIEVKNLFKKYTVKNGIEVKALDDVSLKIDKVGMVFLLGKSGAGKSTLLNVLGGLDRVDSGEIIINGKSSKDFSQSDFDSYRNTYLGFIFQEYNILNEFSIAENIALAIELQGRKPTNEEIDNILNQVDLAGLAKRKPNELSGGQKQRVAIARALIKNPQIIMADEPTGALDSKTGKQIFDTLKALSHDKLVLIVSHDREFAEQYADRIIELKDGKVISDVEKTIIQTQNQEGINIIDNKIIKIDKDYILKDEDFLKIKDYIKTAKSDVIISVDNQNNEKIKTIMNLSDEGLCKFIDTNQDKIVIQDENYKTIKSKLGFKKAFKMGASSLKIKKFRLTLTIFLSFLAFMMFGLANTMSSYDNIKTTVNSIVDSNIEYATFKKQKVFSYGEGNNDFYLENSLINEEDVLKISNDTKLNFTKVYGAFQKYEMPSLNYVDFKNIFLEQMSNFNGFTTIDMNFINQYDFDLNGSLPEKDDEIAITKLVEDVIKEYGIRDYNGVEQENLDSALHLEISIFGLKMKIVGVIDTKADISEYQDLKGDSIADYMKMQLFNSYLENGPHLLFFVKDTMIDSLNKMYSNNHDMLEIEWNNQYFTYNKIMNGKENDINDKEILLPYSFVEMIDFFNTVNLNENDEQYQKVIQMPAFNDVMYYLYFMHKQEIVKLFNDKQLTISDSFKNDYHIDSLENQQILYIFKVYQDSFYASSSEDIDKIYQIMDELLQNFNFEKEERITFYNKKMKEYSDQLFINIAYYSDRNYYNTIYQIVGITDNAEAVIIHDDELFDNYINVDDGIYKYVFAKMPTSDKEIKKLVEYHFQPVTKVGESVFSLNNEVVKTLTEINSIFEVCSKIFLYVGLGFAIFASLLLLNFITISINYKKREIGILRAVGARSKDVFKIFFSESLIIAIINAILANISLFIVVFCINTTLRKNYNLLITILNPGILQIILVFGISILVAFVSSFVPVYFIANKRPIDAINNR